MLSPYASVPDCPTYCTTASDHYKDYHAALTSISQVLFSADQLRHQSLPCGEWPLYTFLLCLARMKCTHHLIYHTTVAFTFFLFWFLEGLFDRFSFIHEEKPFSKVLYFFFTRLDSATRGLAGSSIWGFYYTRASTLYHRLLCFIKIRLRRHVTDANCKD